MAFDPRRVQALLFDIDGTLSDTDDLWVAQFTPFFRGPRAKERARWLVMGLESPGNFIYARLDRLDLDGPTSRLLNVFSHWHSRRKPKNYLAIPGVLPMIARLAERYPLGVVSARGEKGSLAFLEKFDLRRYFQSVVTAETCRYTKPFPDPVLEAARQLRVPVVNCVMVGDTTVDIHAGRLAGAQTIGVLCGFGREGELRKAGADLILETTEMVEESLD